MQHAPLPSFGRRHGRKLRDNHQRLLDTVLPRLLIRLPDAFLTGEGRGGGEPMAMSEPVALPPSLILHRKGGGNTGIWFEIGFGSGEHLVEQARRHPEKQFIGCEPYINGMAKLLSAIDTAQLTNIRLFDGDARTLLELMPDHSIERLFVLFPDPWPKNRHHKRRLISQPTLDLFHRKLILGGLLRLATDHVDYGEWMLEQLLQSPHLIWTATCAKDWTNPPMDWVETRYQAKARAEGRNPLFLDWKARNNA